MHEVFDKKFDLRYSTILYLQERVNELVKEHTNQFDSVEKWEKFKAEFRNRLKQILGIPLDSTPISSYILDETEVEGIKIQRVDINFARDYYIPSYVYNPVGIDKKAPAVILSPGWPQTKHENSHNWTAMELARNGFVTVIMDHVCFGERSETNFYDGASFDSRNQTEINIEGISALLGIPLMGLRVWDNIRVLEYLESRDDVNPERIGIIGLCQGGMDTWMAGAVDERYKVVIPICSTTSYEAWTNILPRILSLANSQPYLPGIMKHGDFKHIYSLIAPRPMMIANNFNDCWWPLKGFKETTHFVSEIYKLYDAGDKCKYFLKNTDHTIHSGFLNESIDWFKKWL